MCDFHAYLRVWDWEFLSIGALAREFETENFLKHLFDVQRVNLVDIIFFLVLFIRLYSVSSSSLTFCSLPFAHAPCTIQREGMGKAKSNNICSHTHCCVYKYILFHHIQQSWQNFTLFSYINLLLLDSFALSACAPSTPDRNQPQQQHRNLYYFFPALSQYYNISYFLRFCVREPNTYKDNLWKLLIAITHPVDINTLLGSSANR